MRSPTLFLHAPRFLSYPVSEHFKLESGVWEGTYCNLHLVNRAYWEFILWNMQGVSAEKRVVAATGHLDAKQHLADNAERLMSMNIVQNLATMLDVVVF